MSSFSTSISGALIGCSIFAVGTFYLSACTEYFHEVNEAISQSYGECHSINQACLESSLHTGDHTTCLLTSGWLQANERYQFQQRKSEKVKYQLGRVVELII